MFDHISNQTTRACLERLAQLHREHDDTGIPSFVGGLARAAEEPAVGELLLATLVQI